LDKKNEFKYKYILHFKLKEKRWQLQSKLFCTASHVC